MSECPFCDRVFEGKYFATVVSGVVMFEPLNPVTPGHLLFLPRMHIKWSYPNSAEMAGRCVQAAAVEGADQFNIITSYGANATQTIEHIHIHLVPRREGDGLQLPWTGQE